MKVKGISPQYNFPLDDYNILWMESRRQFILRHIESKEVKLNHVIQELSQSL